MINLPAKSLAAPTGSIRMELWAASSNWKPEEGWCVHRGRGLVLYPSAPSSGPFIFSARRPAGVFGKGRIRWVAGCFEAQSNYILFGIDKKSIHHARVLGGKKQKEESKTLKIQAKDLEYTLRIDISADGVVTYVQNGANWELADTFTATGLDPASGKFGFYLPGTDEVYISNFKFEPK